jgi:oxygen-dependent protoporphyrinogen oxidase
LARARHAGAPIDEFLIEAKDRLGGVIQTENVDGFVIEAGPDSFLTEKPEAAALCRELGIGDSLLGSNDSERRTYILHRGKLTPLPDGLMLLVPTRIWPMVSTPLLPLHSKVAMASEMMMGPSKNNEDESVADFVRRHFGSAMLDNIADPLLAGVYGGDSALLSARSVLNRFWKMEKKHGSLTRAVLQARRQRKADAKKAGKAPRTPPPLFTTLKQGLSQLTETLIKNLDSARLHTGQRVEAIDPGAERSGPRFQIRCEGNAAYDADAIVMAMPAHACSRLLPAVDPALAESLAGVPYNSAMTVALAYDEQVARKLPPGFGFLVPRKENRRLLACTFVQGKFAHRAPEGKALLRCFMGGARDQEVLKLSDEEIVTLVRRDLASILKLTAEPLFHRVHRWPASMAQYQVGHDEAVARITAQVEKHPGLAVAGNAYSGIGISDCVRTGRAAAERVLEYLRK